MYQAPFLLALAALAGCAAGGGEDLRAGVSTEAQVRQSMGRPAATFDNGDGSRRLAYPRGPLGTQTFMADVGGDGKLTRIACAVGEQPVVLAGGERDVPLRVGAAFCDFQKHAFSAAALCAHAGHALDEARRDGELLNWRVL